MQPLLPEFLKITIEIPKVDLITKNDLRAKTDLATGGSPITVIDAHIEDVPITTVILDIESAHTIKSVITCTTIIKGTGTPIKAIGGLGTSGIDTLENTHTYTNMEGITANMDI